jgi:hypothetical protein
MHLLLNRVPVWDACFGSIRNVRVINLIAGTNGAKARGPSLRRNDAEVAGGKLFPLDKKLNGTPLATTKPRGCGN